MPLVKLYGNLRLIAGSKELEVPSGTVRAVLNWLCVRNPELCDALLEEGVLRPHVRMMVNGQHVELVQGLETVLGPQDQLSIFPPIAGG